MDNVLKNAILSMDAYNRGPGSGTKVEGDILGYLVRSSQIPNQSESGFSAVIYSLGNERIISFRGTDAINGNDVSGSDGAFGFTLGAGNPNAPPSAIRD